MYVVVNTNICRADFVLGNVKIYFHVRSFLNTEMVLGYKKYYSVKDEDPVYRAYSCNTIVADDMAT